MNELLLVDYPVSYGKIGYHNNVTTSILQFFTNKTILQSLTLLRVRLHNLTPDYVTLRLSYILLSLKTNDSYYALLVSPPHL